MASKGCSTDMSSLIFSTLRNELIELVIKPGEEIQESSVCERFDVTRPPVRTAFQRLSDIGLVEVKPYIGVFATLINLDKIYQIIHLRTVVESQVLRDFIDSKPDDFILEELDHNIRLQKLLIAQPKINQAEFFQQDSSLHQFWFKQQRCLDIWNLIQSQETEYTRFRMLDFVVTQKYTDIVADHEKLVEAIAKGDGSIVESILGTHLNNGLQRFGDKIFTEYSLYFVPPKDTGYWREYNKRYHRTW